MPPSPSASNAAARRARSCSTVSSSPLETAPCSRARARVVASEASARSTPRSTPASAGGSTASTVGRPARRGGGGAVGSGPRGRDHASRAGTPSSGSGSIASAGAGTEVDMSE